MALVVLLVAALAAYFLWFHVRITEYPVPPRSDAAPDYQIEQSVVVATVGVPIGVIRQGMERDIPRTLLRIDRRVEECVPRETINVLGRDLIRTPRIGCRLVGNIRRGAISLSGRGKTLTASFPVDATIEIRDVGDIIKRETATATAIMRVQTSLGVAGDWRLRPDVRLSYNWTRQPGIDVLGQRVTFTRQADAELAKILGSVERSLERRLAQIDVRSEVQDAWLSGFDTLSINRTNPPVWMRITPESAGTSGARVAGKQIVTDLMLRADLEVFVGDQPAKPEPKPLGANMGIARGTGFEITVPVMADYREVEPVILRALQRLAGRGISNKELGRLDVDFESVTLYATEGGRIAVGVEAAVEPVGNITGDLWGRSRGTVWLTGMPMTEPDSEVVRIEQLEVFGDMDNSIGDLLIRVLASDDVRTEIERALVEDFKGDYDDVIGKAKDGIESVLVGDLDMSFTIEKLSHGKVIPTGQGLFMAVEASGDVTSRLLTR